MYSNDLIKLAPTDSLPLNLWISGLPNSGPVSSYMKDGAKRHHNFRHFKFQFILDHFAG
jgi:hypothetical protein